MQILSGEWQIALDPRNEGREHRWYDQAGPEAVAAPVPGLIQDVFPNYHGVAWYWHTFRVDLTVCEPFDGSPRNASCCASARWTTWGRSG